eukprot:6205476-Pleurochrysis_carterae.AAC.2
MLTAFSATDHKKRRDYAVYPKPHFGQHAWTCVPEARSGAFFEAHTAKVNTANIIKHAHQGNVATASSPLQTERAVEEDHGDSGRTDESISSWL